jgi:Putative Flp pilus-assembly TadE/G-like
MRKYQRGQTLVIFAIAALALVFFIGLAVDSGSLYVTYGQLKRAVDAAAVASANEFKKQDPGHETDILPKMTNAAVEILKLQNIDPNNVAINIRLCDTDFDGVRDSDLQTVAPDFYNRCPDTTAGRQARKLIWVQATQEAPLYFLHMLGFSNIPLTTESIAEAASVDMLIVFDTSESMGKDSPDYVPGADYNPATCNFNNDCLPLKEAKDAAIALIGNLYDGYDRVGIVTFDVQGDVRFNLGENDPMNPKTHLQEAIDAVNNNVRLHDAAPFNKLFMIENAHGQGTFNPVNPEDRDNNGADADEPHPAAENASGDTCTPDSLPSDYGWDQVRNIPCDFKNKHDAFDMDGDHLFTAADDVLPGPTPSVVDTCTGCGLRVASNQLRAWGRSGSVWVMIFLSDGVPNMSDTPTTDPANPDLIPYPNGFCTGGLGSDMWTNLCVDWDWNPRYCIDPASTTCPPLSTWDGTTPSMHYSALDYARDMADTTALTKSLNLDEPGGNEISIYTIGLGAAGDDPYNPAQPVGEQLLRYMAAVGDDGDRQTDPCQGFGSKQTCGQYYYAPTGAALQGIFLDIASRIYTRISE